MKMRDLALAAALGLGLYACEGCDPGNNNNNSNNHPPASFTQSDVAEPVEGSTYQIGQMVPVDFTVPVDEDGDSLEAVVELLVDDDGTPGPSAGDTKVTKDLGTFQSGNQVVNSIDTTGLPAGDGYVTMTVSDSKGGESSLERTIFLRDVQKPVRVSGCDVTGSYVGSSLSITCACESDNGPVTGWDLTGGPSGATIFTNGNILTPTVLGASDVGLHTYDVTCTDGTDTSDVYTFTVPVDEHLSSLTLRCQGGSNETLRLPETSIDAIASSCAAGYNPALKPNTSADADYVLDADYSCIEGAVEGLTAAEKKAHENYNGGKTVADVYDSCTVDFAQVRYHHQ